MFHRGLHDSGGFPDWNYDQRWPTVIDPDQGKCVSRLICERYKPLFSCNHETGACAGRNNGGAACLPGRVSFDDCGRNQNVTGRYLREQFDLDRVRAVAFQDARSDCRLDYWYRGKACTQFFQ